MKPAMLIGAAGALATGVAIAVQATITSRAGAMIGEIRTGLLTNFLGGSLAGLILLILLLTQGVARWRIPLTPMALVGLSGLLGILIITGVAYSFPRTGVAAGVASVILGQLLISVVVDTRGVGGVEPIPLTVERLLGLVLMAVAVYLLLPRS